MKVLLLLLLLAVLFGPLRKSFFGNAPFTIPATVGLLVGFGLGSFVAGMAGLPGPLALLLALTAGAALAVSFGGVVKSWFNDTFGEKK